MFKSLKKYSVLAVVAVTGFVVSAVRADPPAVNLPDTGVDVTSYLNAAITQLGTILGVTIAAMFAFIIIKHGVRLVRRALSKA